MTFISFENVRIYIFFLIWIIFFISSLMSSNFVICLFLLIFYFTCFTILRFFQTTTSISLFFIDITLNFKCAASVFATLLKKFDPILSCFGIDTGKLPAHFYRHWSELPKKKNKKIKYCNTISAKDKNMTLMCSVGIRLITHLYVTAIIILLYTEIYSCFTRTYAEGVQLAYSIHDTGMPGSLRVAVSFNL